MIWVLLSAAVHAGIAALWLRRKPKPKAVIRRDEFDAEAFETIAVGIMIEEGNTVRLVNLETKKRLQFIGMEAWGIETAIPQGSAFDTLPARVLFKGLPAINGVHHGNGE